jgi:hypothetical protein
MDRDDLLSHEWIQHLIEELQDAILYLKKIQTLQNGTQRHTDSQEANSGNVEQVRSIGEISNT